MTGRVKGKLQWGSGTDTSARPELRRLDSFLARFLGVRRVEQVVTEAVFMKSVIKASLFRQGFRFRKVGVSESW